MSTCRPVTSRGAVRRQRAVPVVRLRSGLVAAVAFALCSCGSSVQSQEDARAFFESEAEPLLAEKCLGCHSHAARTMEGGLALDSRVGWQSGGQRGPAVVPGDPDRSLLIRAIRYEDPELQMPPEEKLSASEIRILEAWVRDGAVDPREATVTAAPDTDWWSLRPPVMPEVPGSGHPIDAFIQAKLADHGLQPAERADRLTLVRRLYTDLHGMQPTPEEAAAFAADDSDDAVARLTDRLLESPRYGERWARHWLDVIHFADSHGCEHDVKRPNAWRYRDYVINRLNEDVPWGRFIREQLAPDVFYPDEPQLTAGLGFVVAGPLELSRAGTAPVSFDYLDRDDIVTQTMAAFASTTAGCARCHTHKFDPVTQEDYYSLQAVFAGVGRGDIEYDESAEVLHRRRELERLQAACRSTDAEILLQDRYAEVTDEWIAARRQEAAEWITLVPDVFLSSGGATLTRQDDNSVFADGALPDQETYTITASVDSVRISAVRLEVLPDERLPEGGPGRAGNGNLHLTEAELHWFGAGETVSRRLNIIRTSADYDQEGWTSAQSIDGDMQSGWAVYPRVGESHLIVFQPEEPVDAAAGGKLAITLKQLYPPKHVIGRFRLSATSAAAEAAHVLPPVVRQALDKEVDQRTREERAVIAAAALAPWAARETEALPPRVSVYGVSDLWSHAKPLENPQLPKTVHLLRRGAFDRPVREVVPGALSALTHSPSRFELPEHAHESQRRAALAEWLAHPDNPLTWRSIVNRVWHYHFGRGLTDTPNDFGRMGSLPSHPELLDWLAVWFRDEARGSLKQLHRLILTSAAWQRSSAGTPDSDDSENVLLSRMNRQRMDADVFRDSVLRISGQLDLTEGGPGVEEFVKTKGPQATPTLDYAAFDRESAGGARRSIYRVVWRGIPDPFMEALDFPDLGLSAPKRGFSVSALQSLSLYNNSLVLHNSRRLAERIESECEGTEARIDRAVELVWLRQPDSAERAQFAEFVRLHGLPAFCRVLFNSNEFLFVD